MAKSHKTCMEQAEIIDTFGTYHMPPRIPFFINNYQFVPRCTIFLSLHTLCAMLGASRSLLFLVSFALRAVVTSQTPAFFCVGEKHAPLKLEHLIGFACFFLSCQLFFIFS